MAKGKYYDKSLSEVKESKEYKFAVKNGGQLHFVRELMSYNYGINEKDDEGKTFLHDAQDLQLVEYLAKNRADIDAQDNKGKTALHYAAENGNKSVMQALLQPPVKEELELAYYDYDDPPEEEINQSQPESLYKAADVNLQDNEGKTALHYAVERGDRSLIEYLLSQDANINAKDKKDNTPLHYALEQNNLDLARYLLSQKADVNVQNEEGKTLLHYAAEQDKKNIAEYLISQGANVDAQD